MKHLKKLNESNIGESQEMIYELEDMSTDLIQDHGVRVNVIPYLFLKAEVLRFLIEVGFKSDKIEQYLEFFKSVYSIAQYYEYDMMINIRTKPTDRNKSIKLSKSPGPAYGKYEHNITSKESVDKIFDNIDLDKIFDLSVQLIKVERKEISENMKHLKRFNENFEDNQDIQQDILYIFLPLENTQVKVSLESGSGGKSNHIAVEVVAEDTINGFDDTEKEVLKDILKEFENWLSYNEFEIVDRPESDVSYIELVEAETICPECGSYDVDSSGYDYNSGKSWSECEDCEHRASDDDFEDRYLNFYDFEKLNQILFETDENKIQHAVAINIVIKV